MNLKPPFCSFGTMSCRPAPFSLPLLLLLLLLLTCGITSRADHHQSQHHRHHHKAVAHAHQETGQWRKAYREYLQLYYPKLLELSLGADGLPWFFHLFPHFPFPFWPPFLQPPPPIQTPPAPEKPQPPVVNFTIKDMDRINVALNVHYLQAEFFLHAAYGYGLDNMNLTLGKRKAAPSVGGQKAQLSQKVEHVARELGLESTGHIRAIHDKLADRAIRRPLLNISKSVWHNFISQAFENDTLEPAFDPYANDVNFLLAAYVIPYIGLNTLVDSSHRVVGIEARKLVSALLGVEAAQDAVIRTLLFEVLQSQVAPYNVTVGEFTVKVSNLRHKLDHSTKADEGLLVHFSQGAEKRLRGNLVSANDYSLSISRTPQQIFQLLYGTGDASKPGAFFPKGANGQTAKVYLKRGRLPS